MNAFKSSKPVSVEKVVKTIEEKPIVILELTPQEITQLRSLASYDLSIPKAIGENFGYPQINTKKFLNSLYEALERV